jgi:hypothetical protein
VESLSFFIYLIPGVDSASNRNLSSAKFKNEWSSSPIFPHGAHRDKCALNSPSMKPSENGKVYIHYVCMHAEGRSVLYFVRGIVL